MLFKMCIRVTWGIYPKCKFLVPPPNLWKKNDFEILLSLCTLKFLLA